MLWLKISWKLWRKRFVGVSICTESINTNTVPFLNGNGNGFCFELGSRPIRKRKD